MVTEDYVSFETAKLLKEKGFSENTICKYADVGGVTEKWYDEYRERVVRFDWQEGYLIKPPSEPLDQYEIIGGTISAPTLQRAMKWLRKEHNKIIIPSIRVTDPITGIIDCYCVGIYYIPKNNGGALCFTSPTPGNGYSTYEEACEAGIKYCLENLI